MREVDGVSGSARRVLGVAVGPEEAVRVVARITSGRTELDVRLAVDYPRSVAATTSQARAHLVACVEELTGLIVTRVDITITSLPTSVAVRRRVEQSRPHRVPEALDRPFGPGFLLCAKPSGPTARQTGDPRSVRT